MIFRHFVLPLLCCAALISCGGNNSDSNNTSKQQTAADATPAATGAVKVFSGTSINPDTIPTIIDFNATWCGPCQRFAPIFEEVARQYEGKAQFLSVDVDNSPYIAQRFEVSAIPQLTVLMPDGTVKSTVGFMDKNQFIQFISPLLAK